MAKKEWGTKRNCLSCGAPFYDLGQKNIECPKCHAAFDSKPPAKRKRPTPATKHKEPVSEVGEAPPKSPEVLAAAVADGDDNPGIKAEIAPTGDGDGKGDAKDKKEDGPVEDEEKSDELIEDTSDLGQDDDDMSEVKEHIDDGVEDKN